MLMRLLRESLPAFYAKLRDGDLFAWSCAGVLLLIAAGLGTAFLVVWRNDKKEEERKRKRRALKGY